MPSLPLLCVYVLLSTQQDCCCRFVMACMQALAAMVKLELPHINLLTKMDLAEDKQAVEEFLIPDKQMLLDRWAGGAGVSG